MKRFVTAPLKAFLLSNPQQLIVADCFTLTLITGEVFRLTSFDWDVSIAADPTIQQPGGAFTAMGSRIKRGRIQNKRGLETSQMDLTLAPDIFPDLSAGSLAAPPAQVGRVSLTEAAVATLLYGATIRVETVYGDPVSGGGLTRLPNGTYSDGGWGSIIKFAGIIGDIEVVKQSMRMACLSTLHLLETDWPPFQIQPLCRWRLFDAGCANIFNAIGNMTGGSPNLSAVIGVTLVADTFEGRPITIAGAGPGGRALVTTIQTVTSPSSCVLAAPAIGGVSGAAVTVGLLAANFAVSGVVTLGDIPNTVIQVYNNLANPSGYFSGGRVAFITGQNAGLSRTIKAGIGAGLGASYVAAVLNDTPYFFYRLNETVGATVAVDSSPNGFSASVHGGVTFGQASLLAGDTGTGALFNGSSGYLLANAPRPHSQGMLAFDFWYKLSGGASARQPEGIFDTNAGQLGGCKNTGILPGDTLPGFIWNTNRPYVGIVSPAGAVHCAVVFRGANTIDVYLNGALYDSLTQFGFGKIQWTDPVWIGKTAISAALTTHFFNGTLQDFACYAYPLAADQVYTHYLAGLLAPSINGQGLFTLSTPLPYVPVIGDQFVAYPGCNKTMRQCDNKFHNLLQIGSQPFVPQPEAGV